MTFEEFLDWDDGSGRLAVFYDRDTIIGFTSRIVYEHLQHNWEKLYTSQVKLEKLENWRD